MPKILYKAEVAPLAVLPYRKSIFSYATHIKLSPGDLVTISFGKRTLSGIVLSCQKLPGRKPSWLKEISHVEIPGWLTPGQLALADFVSTAYFTPLGKVLKHFSPARVKARKKKDSPLPLKIFRATKKESALLKQLWASKKSSAYLNLILDAEGVHVLQALSKAVLQKKQSVLILAPEIISVAALNQAFREFFPEKDIVTLHSGLAKGVYAENWERIRTARGLAIISTRQGMFAPFQDLGVVIQTEAGDESYKQWDQSPRYATAPVITRLCTLQGARFLTCGALPSETALKAIQSADMLDLSVAPQEVLPLTYVNLRLERYKKNFSPFSEELRIAITALLEQQKRVLLWVTQSGESHFSVCTECKNIFRCPRCGQALKQLRDGKFLCSNCGFQTGSFPSCPHCKGLTFRNFGFGTAKVTREAKKLFPKARVVEATKGELSTLAQTEAFLRDISAGKADIVVGTQLALKSLPLSDLGLIGIIDADSMIHFGGFQADADYLTLITRASRQVAGTGGRVEIQTFYPENRLFQETVSLPPRELLEKLLGDRQALHYPPFTRALLIEPFSEKSPSLDALEDTFLKECASLIKKKRVFIGIIETRRSNHTVLKLLIRYYEPMPQILQTLLERYSDVFLIDHDPLKFL